MRSSKLEVLNVIKIPVSEGFKWAQLLWPMLKGFQKQFENDGAAYYQVVANHADIKNRNGRVYTDGELRKAGASLSKRPLNVNHDSGKMLDFPDNQVVAARYEDGRVECIIQVRRSRDQQNDPERGNWGGFYRGDVSR